MEFYHHHLTSEPEKSIYRNLKDAVQSHKESLDIPDNVSGTQISQLFMYLLMDYPDFFWTKGDFTLFEDRDAAAQRRRIRLHYLYDEADCLRKGKQIQEALMEICTGIDAGVSPETIVRSVAAWFQNKVTYSVVPGVDQTIYSALVMRKSVCMGISRAVKLVLRLFGIDSIVVLGALFQNNTHAWNMVCLDHTWYHLDIAAGYECFDSVWAAHGIQGRKPLILVKAEDLEETHTMRDEITYPE